jgi:phosphoribosyl-AMP cyclohydrolase
VGSIQVGQHAAHVINEVFAAILDIKVVAGHVRQPVQALTVAVPYRTDIEIANQRHEAFAQAVAKGKSAYFSRRAIKDWNNG